MRANKQGAVASQHLVLLKYLVGFVVGVLIGGYLGYAIALETMGGGFLTAGGIAIVGGGIVGGGVGLLLAWASVQNNLRTTPIQLGRSSLR